MKTIWHGTLTFGLVSVPVGLAKAQDRKKVGFVQLHSGCGERIKMPKSCPTHGDLVSGDIVKGYEYEPEKYVEVLDSVLESAAAEGGKSITIERFIDASEVDPILLEKTYYLMPSKEADQRAGYVLLRTALEESGNAAVARFTLWGQENLCMVRAHDGVLVLDVLYYAEDIRDDEPVKKELAGVKVGEAEVDLARELVESLRGDFDHSSFHDGHRERVRALVADLAKGKKPKAAKEKAPKKVDANQLQDALKRSVAAAQKGKAKPKPKPRKRTTKA